MVGPLQSAGISSAISASPLLLTANRTDGPCLDREDGGDTLLPFSVSVSRCALLLCQDSPTLDLCDGPLKNSLGPNQSVCVVLFCCWSTFIFTSAGTSSQHHKRLLTCWEALHSAPLI